MRGCIPVLLSSLEEGAEKNSTMDEKRFGGLI
jgi:hypothetical protein